MTGEIPEYKPEQATNYEIAVNAQTATIAPVTNNAEKFSITGLEVETLWLPLPNLDIAVAMTAELPAEDCELATPAPGTTVDGCLVDCSAEDLPTLPKQIYYLAAQYHWDTQSTGIAWSDPRTYSVEPAYTC